MINSYPRSEHFTGRSGLADLSLVHRNLGDSEGGPVEENRRLLSGITPADYATIAAAGRVKEFSRGEILYVEGDSVQQVMLLRSGFVKITQLGFRGAEVILRVAVAGDVLGALGLSTGRHYTTTQTCRSCKALVWEASVFKALVERFPLLHQNLVRIMGEHLRELEERFREVATERVAPRVARQLVRLLKTIGRPVDGAVEIGLSREQLAQMTGTTLFTVSRLLSAWEARGMVKRQREAVTICDVRLLSAISEES